MEKTVILKMGDLIVIGVAVLLALLLWAAFFLCRDGSGDQGLSVRIYINGELISSIDMPDEEQELRFDSATGYNVLSIGPQGARIIESDCRNQDCVRTGLQNRPGSVIACLPHRLLILIDGGKEAELDAITR